MRPLTIVSYNFDRTFNLIGNKDRILQKLDEVATELEEDMERGGWTGRTITLKYKLDTYQGSVLFSALYPTSSAEDDAYGH